jgi:hypothetical protein
VIPEGTQVVTVGHHNLESFRLWTYSKSWPYPIVES